MVAVGVEEGGEADMAEEVEGEEEDMVVTIRTTFLLTPPWYRRERIAQLPGRRVEKLYS